MNNKLYIADTYLHYDLQQTLLKQNNNTALGNLQILDFHTFLSQYAKDESNSLNAYATLYARFQNVKDNLFESLLAKPAFLAEIYHIHETLQRNNTLVDELPHTQKAQQSLIELLSKCEDIATSGSFLKQAYHVINSIQDFSNVTFVNFSYTCTWEEKIMEAMCQKGAKCIHTQIPTQSISYHFALNKRLECESVAQEIIQLINQKVDLSEIGIMVSDISAYKDVLTFVMQRYNIPLYIPSDTASIAICDFLHVFFTYYATPNQENLINLLSNTFLKTPNCEQLLAYAQALHFGFEDFFQDFNYFEKIKGSPFLNNGNDKILESYEVKAKEAQTHYLSFIQSIDTSSFQTLLETLHHFLSQHTNRLQENEIQLINHFYEEYYSFAKSNSPLPLSFCCNLAKEHFAHRQINNERTTNNILVFDLHSPAMNLKYGFLVGMHQKTYPAFTSYSGLLNEELIAQLPNFLSLSKRYTNHIKMVASNLHFAQHLVISYPQSNYEGKTNEPSLELTMEFQLDKPTAYPVHENNQQYTRSYELEPDLAKDLFFKDNTIYGSISSFEKYFNCPYAYFLKSGLKIKNLFSFTIQEAEIGTLQHAFLEQMVKTKGKEYVHVQEEDIQSFLEEQFLHYETAFRHDQTTIDNYKKQIKTNLKNVLANLEQMEAHTAFNPKAQEYPFDFDLLTYKQITLHLRGIIDRVDEITQGIRIIDYKSSNKRFYKDKFLTGESLQLITYAYIASELLKKEVFGVYYFSMRIPSSTQIAASVARPRYSKKLTQYEISIPTTQEMLEQRKVNALQGQTFVEESTDLLLLDDTSGTFVADIKKGNKGEQEEGILAKVKKPYAFEDAKTHLEQIYQYLIESLLQGRIECSPSEGACTYCEYSSICMYKGAYQNHRPIIDDESEVN